MSTAAHRKGRRVRESIEIPQRFYTAQEVAKIFGVSVTAVYKWTRGGRLPVEFFENAKRYPRVIIDAIARGEVGYGEAVEAWERLRNSAPTSHRLEVVQGG